MCPVWLLLRDREDERFLGPRSPLLLHSPAGDRQPRVLWEPGGLICYVRVMTVAEPAGCSGILCVASPTGFRGSWYV